MTAKKQSTDTGTKFTYALWEQTYLPETASVSEKKPSVERTEAFTQRFLQHAATALARSSAKK